MEDKNWLKDMYDASFNILNDNKEVPTTPPVQQQPEGILLNEQEIDPSEEEVTEEVYEEETVEVDPSEEEYEFEEDSEEEELDEEVSDEDFIVTLLEDVQLAADVELTEEEIEVILETVTLVVEGMVQKMGEAKSIEEATYSSESGRSKKSREKLNKYKASKGEKVETEEERQARYASYKNKKS